MIVLANILQGVAGVLGMLLYFLTILLIASVVISWVNADPNNPLVRFITGATEPFLRPLRRKIPPLGMLDLTPLILFAVLYLLQIVVVQSLQDYAAKMSYQARISG